jgi:hypothetical protein
MHMGAKIAFFFCPFNPTSSHALSYLFVSLYYVSVDSHRIGQLFSEKKWKKEKLPAAPTRLPRSRVI